MSPQKIDCRVSRRGEGEVKSDSVVNLASDIALEEACGC